MNPDLSESLGVYRRDLVAWKTQRGFVGEVRSVLVPERRPVE